MALEDAVQRVTIEGAEEVQQALKNIGETGAQAFAQIVEAASHGDFTGLVTMIGGNVAGAFTEAAKSVIEFADAQAEAIEKTNALSEVFGTTLEQTAGLKEAFAGAGVSASGLDRLMQRMSMNTARNWGQIQQSMREAGTQSEASLERITSAQLSVEKAQQNLSEEGSKSAQQAVDDFDNIQKAALSLEAAQNKLTTASGGSVSPGAKQALEQKEALLGLQEAQEAVGKANQKAVEDSIQADMKHKEAIEQVKEANTKLEEAQEHAYDQSLKSIPEVVGLLQKLETGTASAADSMKLMDVSSGTVSRAIEAMASSTGKVATGFDVFKTLGDLFSKTGDEALTMQQKIEILQKVGGTSMRAMGGDAAKIVQLLSQGGDYAKQFAESASKIGLALKDEDVQKAKDLEKSSGELATHWDELKAKMGAAVAPGVSEFFKNLDAILVKLAPTVIKLAEVFGQLFKIGSPQFGNVGNTPNATNGPDANKIWKPGEQQTPGVSTTGDKQASAADVQKQAAEKAQDAATKFADSIDKIVSSVNPSAPGATPGSSPDSAPSVVDQWRGGLTSIPGYAGGGGVDGGILRVPGYAAGGLISSIARLRAYPNIGPTVGFAEGGGMTEDDINEDYQLARNQADLAYQRSRHTAADSAERDLAIRKAEDEKDRKLRELYKYGSQILGGQTTGSTGDSSDAASMAAWQSAGVPGTSIVSGPGPGGFAEGGHIRGPGTGTSDSIVARVSNGEYITRALAVRHYGADIMNAINELRVPKSAFFADGGYVGHIPRFAGGGIAEGGGKQSVLNLTIDGQTFRGLKAPANTAAQLKSFAISRQTTKTGNMPSWVK